MAQYSAHCQTPFTGRTAKRLSNVFIWKKSLLIYSWILQLWSPSITIENFQARSYSLLHLTEYMSQIFFFRTWTRQAKPPTMATTKADFNIICCRGGDLFDDQWKANIVVNRDGRLSQTLSTKYEFRLTCCIPAMITGGIGWVVSPIPRLITLASGYLAVCTASLDSIWIQNLLFVKHGMWWGCCQSYTASRMAVITIFEQTTEHCLHRVELSLRKNHVCAKKETTSADSPQGRGILLEAFQSWHFVEH